MQADPGRQPPHRGLPVTAEQTQRQRPLPQHCHGVGRVGPGAVLHGDQTQQGAIESHRQHGGTAALQALLAGPAVALDHHTHALKPSQPTHPEQRRGPGNGTEPRHADHRLLDPGLQPIAR